MTIKPLFDKLLLKKSEVQEYTHGGIALPDMVQANEKKRMGRGVVVAIGPGRQSESDGSVVCLVPEQVQVGTEVYYAEYAGRDVKDNQGREFVIISAYDLLAYIEETVEERKAKKK